MGHYRERDGEHRTKPPKIRRMHENDLVAVMAAIVMSGENSRGASDAVSTAREILKVVKADRAETVGS